MIIRAPSISVGESQISDVMLNLIDDHQLRFKVTMDGQFHDLYIRNWFVDAKGLNVNLIFNGIEVPTQKPIGIRCTCDLLKKQIHVSGQFINQKIDIRTTPAQLFGEFLKMLRNSK